MFQSMEALFFSTGQAAEQLKITQDMVRTLCRTQLIKTETTFGGQLRIPQAEIQRLKESGIPPIPRPLPGERTDPIAARRRADRGFRQGPRPGS